MTLGKEQFGHRGQEHEDHRAEDAEERHTKARQSEPRIGRGGFFRNGWRVGLDAADHEFRIDGPGHGSGRNPNHKAPEEHQAHVGFERLDGYHGARVRRHDSMHDR